MPGPSTDIRTPDPRPRIVDDGTRVAGTRCRTCSYVTAMTVPWCPVCHGQAEPAMFGPTGRVWSSTVVRVPIPGRTPSYALAYVDLKDGPRVLAHVRDHQEPLAIGTVVRLAGRDSDGGDIQVEVAG